MIFRRSKLKNITLEKNFLFMLKLHIVEPSLKHPRDINNHFLYFPLYALGDLSVERKAKAFSQFITEHSASATATCKDACACFEALHFSLQEENLVCKEIKGVRRDTFLHSSHRPSWFISSCTAQPAHCTLSMSSKVVSFAFFRRTSFDRGPLAHFFGMQVPKFFGVRK